MTPILLPGSLDKKIERREMGKMSNNEQLMGKDKSTARRIAFAAMFTSLALVLSITENYIPIYAIIPVPGIKLGLANIVTVFAIVTLKPTDTIFIIMARCLVMGLFTGPVSFAFSITGAITAFIVMIVLMPGLSKIFSVVGISIAGAATHNIGQIAVAVVLLKDIRIMLFYLPVLLFVSVFTGGITGIAAIPVIRNIKKIV